MDWVEKVVLVTGGANGIGKAISQAFLNAGATVIVADVDAMNGETVVEEWKKDNLNAVFCKINLVDVAAIIKMFEDLVGRYGKIDVLVNNAGKGIFKPLLNYPLRNGTKSFISISELLLSLRNNLQSTMSRIIMAGSSILPLHVI